MITQHRVMNGRWLVLFPGTAEGEQAAKDARRSDPRLKYGRIEKVLQCKPQEVTTGTLYCRFCSEAQGNCHCFGGN